MQDKTLKEVWPLDSSWSIEKSSYNSPEGKLCDIRICNKESTEPEIEYKGLSEVELHNLITEWIELLHGPKPAGGYCGQ